MYQQQLQIDEEVELKKKIALYYHQLVSYNTLSINLTFLNYSSNRASTNGL